jgi:hypothetical protein
MNDKIVAYLDLLGFCSFTRQDKNGAIKMLNDYLTVLDIKVTEDALHPPNSNSTIELRALAKRKSIDTFSHFLPFSDSIFVVSEDEDPTNFLTQLGNFVLEVFLFGQRGWRDEANPVSENITHVTFEGNGKENKTDLMENRFPVLFRSGIVYGNAEIFKNEPLISIVDKQRQKTHIVSGKAVVDAVGLVEGGKTRCPDILLSPCLVDKIKDSGFKQTYIETYEQHSRLLWPAFNYDPDKNLNKFSEMFCPAVNLWNYYSHLECSDIYFNFLKLIIKSAMSLFCGTAESCTKTYINRQIDDLGMSSKKDALWAE